MDYELNNRSIIEGTGGVKQVFLRVKSRYTSVFGLGSLAFEEQSSPCKDPRPKSKDQIIMNIRSILVPTDFSECGNYALSYAASLARLFGASILCVHVIEPMVPTVGYSGMTEPLPLADISDQLEDSAERELPKLADCEECAGIEVEELIVHGEAASEIVRVAKEKAADLIVVSSHGGTGLGRILFGSTAEAIVRHAPCPVLVVKPS